MNSAVFFLRNGQGKQSMSKPTAGSEGHDDEEEHNKDADGDLKDQDAW